MTLNPRLDELLVQRGFFDDIHCAKASVLAGEVIVGFHRETNAGKRLPNTVDIRLKNQNDFVSRGGKKLQGAIDAFSLDVSGRNCVDLGASSGGFTDCLLKAGAAHVSAIDVGYGQFVWKLRGDARVSLYERTNIRGLDPKKVGGPFDVIVGDLSFISLQKLMFDIYNFCAPSANVILLVKPQFEAKKEEILDGGLVCSKSVHERVLHEVLNSANNCGLSCLGLSFSPIKGAKGNIEYFIFLHLGKSVENDSSMHVAYIKELVCSAHETLGGKS